MEYDTELLDRLLDSVIHDPDEVKYKLRRYVTSTEWPSAIEVVLWHHPDLANGMSVDFRRAYFTPCSADFRELETFCFIQNPEELVTIACMALLAWEQMIRFKTECEQTGQVKP